MLLYGGLLLHQALASSINASWLSCFCGEFMLTNDFEGLLFISP
jgi:hypothetical protein